MSYVWFEKTKKLMRKHGITRDEKGLKKLHDKYEENFQKMVKFMGKPAHKTYLKIEGELNHIEIDLRKFLGISASFNPCRLGSDGVDCRVCTGYYMPNDRGYIVMCEEDDIGSTQCDLWEYSKNGTKKLLLDVFQGVNMHKKVTI